MGLRHIVHVLKRQRFVIARRVIQAAFILFFLELHLVANQVIVYAPLAIVILGAVAIGVMIPHLTKEEQPGLSDFDYQMGYYEILYAIPFAILSLFMLVAVEKTGPIIGMTITCIAVNLFLAEVMPIVCADLYWRIKYLEQKRRQHGIETMPPGDRRNPEEIISTTRHGS